jgi:hypothetical protein
MADGRTHSDAASRIEVCLSVFIVAAVVAAGLYRLRFGIGFTDEGMYLSNPFRYLLGDVPYRDDITNSVRGFELILWFVMRLLPNAGNVLIMRYIWVVFHFLCVGALVLSLRRYMPPIALAAAFALIAFLNVGGKWTPGYDVMTPDFMCLCLSCWVSGMFSDRFAARSLWGAGAGVAFAMGALCYMPLAVLLVIPAGFIVYGLLAKENNRRIIPCNAAWIAVSCALIAAGVGLLFAFGLWKDFHHAYLVLKNSETYHATIFSRLRIFAAGIPWPMIVAQCVCMVAVAALIIYRETHEAAKQFVGTLSVLTAFVVFGAMIFILIRPDIFIEGMSILGAMAFLLSLRKRSALSAEAMLPLYGLFLFGSIWHAAVGVISNTHYKTATYTAAPLLVLLMITAYRLLYDKAGRARADGGMKAPRFLLAVFFLMCAVNITGGVFAYSYNDDTLRYLNTPFTYGRLRGIYSTKERVADVESLLRWLEPRVRPGDYLLAYREIPLLYYLTGTRPALNYTGNFPPTWSPAEQRDAVDYMLRNKRVPEYAVRQIVFPGNIGKPLDFLPFAGRAWPVRILMPQLFKYPARQRYVPYSASEEIEPANAFVMKHYRFVKRMGSFEIWRYRVQKDHGSGNVKN